MADKSEQVVTLEEKITQAKELYGRGSRNYLVKSYNEAADDLSQVCKLYEDIYGQISDELGMPYLLYAKSLIALAQDENKVIDVPEEEDQDDEDDDDEEEEENDDEGKPAEDEKEAEVTQSTKTEEAQENGKSTNGDHKKMEVDMAENKDNEAEAVTTTEDEKAEASGKVSETVKSSNDTKSADAEKESAIVEKKSEIEASKEAETTSSKIEKDTIAKPVTKTNGNPKIMEAEPGTSNGANTEANDENEDDDEAAANLQVAWEILELASIIFERQGEKALGKLAEVYGELAGISFENSHFEAAIADFKHSLAIHMKLPDDNRRIIAEIHYKIGLAYLMQNSFDDCIRELKKASELIDEEIEEEKQKENLTEKQKDAIKDLEETKQDILAKITEVEETKQQSIEEVRNELSKLISTQPSSSSDGAGPSSSKFSSDAGADVSSSSSAAVAAEKPKATDISHLIKRKKPDTATPADVESSPAKRPAA